MTARFYFGLKEILGMYVCNYAGAQEHKGQRLNLSVRALKVIFSAFLYFYFWLHIKLQKRTLKKSSCILLIQITHTWNGQRPLRKQTKKPHRPPLVSLGLHIVHESIMDGDGSETICKHKCGCTLMPQRAIRAFTLAGFWKSLFLKCCAMAHQLLTAGRRSRM